MPAESFPAPITRRFAGLKVSPLTRADLLALFIDRLTDRRQLTVTFLNPDYGRRALLSSSLLNDINRFELVLVDGNGVRLLTPLFGFTVPERLDTDSIALSLFPLLAERGARVFLFGCAPGVAEEAAQVLAAAFPGVEVVGCEHGFHDILSGHPGRFAPEDSAGIVAKINASAPDLLLVSLPTPLQQRWVGEHLADLEVPIVMTSGSYLDHLAQSEGATGLWYPPWADRLRLNWFYRLIKEPRRLWRRYTLEVLDFVRLVLRARLGR